MQFIRVGNRAAVIALDEALSASSENELVSWVLSFGDEARVVRPEYLAGKIRQALEKMLAKYPQAPAA